MDLLSKKPIPEMTGKDFAIVASYQCKPMLVAKIGNGLKELFFRRDNFHQRHLFFLCRPRPFSLGRFCRPLAGWGSSTIFRKT